MTEPTKTYNVGQEIRLRGTITDPDTGSPVSPSDVRCVVVYPDKEVGALDAVEAETGSGVFDAFLTPQPGGSGSYYYEFFSMDDFKATSDPRRLNVRREIVPRPTD